MPVSGSAGRSDAVLPDLDSMERSAMRQEFDAELLKSPDGDILYLLIPFSAEETFGSRGVI